MSRETHLQAREPAFMHQCTEEIKREIRDRLTISGVLKRVRGGGDSSSKLGQEGCFLRGKKKKKPSLLLRKPRNEQQLVTSLASQGGMLTQSAPEEQRH